MAKQHRQVKQAPLFSSGIPPVKRVYTMKELVEVVGRCRAAIYSDIRRGVFPKPIATGPKSRRWIVQEVEQWLQARAAEREPRSA